MQGTTLRVALVTIIALQSAHVLVPWSDAVMPNWERFPMESQGRHRNCTSMSMRLMLLTPTDSNISKHYPGCKFSWGVINYYVVRYNFISRLIHIKLDIFYHFFHKILPHFWKRMKRKIWWKEKKKLDLIFLFFSFSHNYLFWYT